MKVKVKKTSDIILVLFLLSIQVFTNGSTIMKAMKLVCVSLTFILIIFKRNIKWNNYLSWIFLNTILAMFSYFWALSKEYALDGLKTVLLNSLCLFSIIQLVYMSKDWRLAVYNSLSIGPILRFLVLIFQYGFSVFGGLRNLEATGYNSIGMFAGLGVSFSLLVYVYYQQKYGLLKKLVLFRFFLNSIIVALSMSRKAFMYLVIPIAIFCLLSSRNYIKAFRNVILVCFGCIAVYFAVLNIPFLYNYIGAGLSSLFKFWKKSNGDISAAGRMTRILFGLKWFNKNPLLGYGVMNYNYLFGSVQPFSDMVIADNNYIDLLVNYGVVGFVIYYSIHVISLVYALKNRRRDLKQQSMAFAILLTLLICDYGSSSYIYLHCQLYLAIVILILYEGERKIRLKNIKF
ncbi:MAG TPA: O-antigen ligase family protein [Candidatus Anaerostipes excrementavium]|uniref:O-antigen ligase family protein n=1 Tax=Candidatus Anaerostipes excrementavium TaxID=2838463 RepID=A0A9D2B8Q5_9FIRM|nr:O-antigen ligase family protein [uncultured Anaerostipes sp.]HIX67196.1 O-antigen ligase family protein [Candidatus Anaerostipes excrementavium]